MDTEGELVNGHALDQFRSVGLVVLRGAFEPAPLTAEVEKALADEFQEARPFNTGSPGNGFQYLPMMGARTPRSLELLAALAEPAARLLGRAVLPVRAKGTRYFGSTKWHRDSELEIGSVGFLAYLEPLDGHNGALWVIPGSHQRPYAAAPDGEPIAGVAGGEPAETQPGDIIAFDEHLVHGSTAGQQRHQWRVDFIPDPVGPDEEATARSYLEAIFPPEWDGGYDVDRYPSYDPKWRRGHEPWVERLAALDAYAAADVQEAAVRAKSR